MIMDKLNGSVNMRITIDEGQMICAKLHCKNIGCEYCPFNGCTQDGTEIKFYTYDSGNQE